MLPGPMTRLLSLAALVALAAPLAAQPMADGPLPFDPAVRQGELANGLRYYVRQNTEPEGRAELRLAIDAGSVLEDEDQRGLAHFLEHMAFNGTERFGEAELVRYLESVGTRFGADLNAYTSFDETVYQLQVPTDSADVFATGLDVLREWAGRITLADSSIERERGVVLEEWRQGKGAGERMNREQFPVLFAGSRYAERLPIGLPDVIRDGPARSAAPLLPRLVPARPHGRRRGRRRGPGRGGGHDPGPLRQPDQPRRRAPAPRLHHPGQPRDAVLGGHRPRGAPDRRPGGLQGPAVHRPHGRGLPRGVGREPVLRRPARPPGRDPAHARRPVRLRLREQRRAWSAPPAARSWWAWPRRARSTRRWRR